VTGTTRLSRDELLSHVGYELRRAKGNGKFIDSIELHDLKRHPIGFYLEDNAIRFGLEFSRLPTGADVLAMQTQGQLICQPEIWIDGFEIPAARSTERLRGMGADLIHGVEIYGPRQLPLPSTGGEIGYTKMLGATVRGSVMQGQRSADTVWRRSQRAVCGAIAVWTKAFVKETIARTRRWWP
jgi:hypothetical protein